MLPVSDLLEVARGEARGQDVSSRAPQRFARPGAQAPVIVWNVCRHCNMRCPHCYANAALRPSPEDLSTDEALRLLDEMAACGVRIVILSGGEPLLRPDLVELATHARQVGIAPQLSTNGVLIDADVAGALARAGVAYVGVSIDGVSDFNDEYRGLDGGHAAACRALVLARQAGMRTGLRMTLTRKNASQLGAVLDLALELETDRFYVSHLLYSGRGSQMCDEDLSRPEARARLLFLFEQAERLLEDSQPTKIVTGSNDSAGPLLLRWIAQRHGEASASPVRDLLLERGGNSAGEKILSIDHRGRVHPDPFWGSETLGDVRRDGFESSLRHPLRRLLRDRLAHLTGRCAACSDRSLCRGSHRERAIAHSGELWAPDPACVMEDAEIGLGEAARVAG